MKLNNVELNVLIKGKSITEYPHNGQVFVEGRHKSKFEIEIRNNNPFSVEAIVSVDGLSVIDGKEAGPASSGYMLTAHEVIRIPGWKLNDEAVAAFEFSGKGDSYAAQSTGSARNTGVIGLMVYREKGRNSYDPLRGLYLGHVSGAALPNMPFSGGYVHTTLTGDNSATWSTGAPGAGHVRGIECSATIGSGLGGAQTKGLLSRGISAPVDMSQTLSANTNATTANAATATQFVGALSMAPQPEVYAAAAIPQNLGTAFGEETDFRTNTVSFERGDLHAVLVLYYDDRQGLTQRGIDLGRRKARCRELPQAFPQMQVGCTPPKGWRR